MNRPVVLRISALSSIAVDRIPRLPDIYPDDRMVPAMTLTFVLSKPTSRPS